MNAERKIRNGLFFYILCFWGGSSLQEESSELTEQQKARVEIICQSVDQWGMNTKTADKVGP